MKTEIEAQFVDVEVASVRTTLQRIGAVLIHKERLMRIKIFKNPSSKENDWFRIRDEGDRITLSYKNLIDRSLHGTQEVTIGVSGFDKTVELLEQTSLAFTSYQEKKRESWKYKSANIDIDTWPWIPPFVEIEGASEDDVRNVSEELGFDWGSALHGSVENIYQHYYEVSEEEVNAWPEITFTRVPEWLEKRRLKKQAL